MLTGAFPVPPARGEIMVKKSFCRRPESNVVVVVVVGPAAGSHDAGNHALDDKFACSNANSNVFGGASE